MKKEFKVPANTKMQITQEGDKVVIEFIPEEVKFEPKNGDFICNGYWVVLVKDFDSEIERHAEVCINTNVFHDNGHAFYDPEFTRFATGSEKQHLINTLAEKGLVWNAEEKRINKITPSKFICTEVVNNLCEFETHSGGRKTATIGFYVEFTNDGDISNMQIKHIISEIMKRCEEIE